MEKERNNQGQILDLGLDACEKIGVGRKLRVLF